MNTIVLADLPMVSGIVRNAAIRDVIHILAVIVSITVAILVTPALCLIFLAGITAGGRVSSLAKRQQLAHKQRLEQFVQHARPLLIFQPQPISLRWI